VDFNRTLQLPPLFIGTADMLYSAADTYRRFTSSGSGNVTWPVANQIIYVPVSFPFRYPVRRVWWLNGATVTGSVNLVIRSQGGAIVYQTGSTAQSGASTIQYVTPTPFLLRPSEYWFGLQVNGTTANLVNGLTSVTTIIGRMAGLVQEAPASMGAATAFTPAQFSSTVWPLLGVTRTASGF
jgi:hypothetical protein